MDDKWIIISMVFLSDCCHTCGQAWQIIFHTLCQVALHIQFTMIQNKVSHLEIQGVLGLHEFWNREKLVEAKFVLVKLCTSTFAKLDASEILRTCYPRNALNLKIRASEIRTSQGPPVHCVICNSEYDIRIPVEYLNSSR